jgi:hypothetical protein
MAGDWIKIEAVTPDKPEIDLLAELLDTTVNEVLGGLVRLWIWADQQTIDGNARSVTKSAIDRHSGVTGLADSMLDPSIQWLVTCEGGGFQFPNFDRHNGQTAKQRALTAKRVAQHKKRSGNDPSVTRALPREEKRREEYKSTPIVPKGTGLEPESEHAAKAVELHPLHARIIRLITPQSKCDRKRDESEMRAWRKVKGQVTEADVVRLERFYALPKSKDCDATWKRKTGVTQLLNQFTEQVELAASVSPGGGTDRPSEKFSMESLAKAKGMRLLGKNFKAAGRNDEDRQSADE